MKKSIIMLSAMTMLLALCLVLCGCGSDKLQAVNFDPEFSQSRYKHINNGGVSDPNGLPYDIDAITGATLTVEGPAVVSSTPLSVREVENLKNGIVRGVYKDKSGTFTYEGLDVYHLLTNMSEGDNGIILTPSAYKVVFKNSNREEIASVSVEDIKKAHENGRPVILAYGIGAEDESTAAPFVFDGAEDELHALGYIEQLKNDDGCIKLVLDAKSCGCKSYKKFSNVAYVYVCEEKEPGFKHTECPQDSFGSAKYTDYIITVRGQAVGAEYDFTVEQLEQLLSCKKSGEIVKDGMGYSDWYSLANNAYWYVNEYKGLKLYDFLQHIGMQSAEDMGTKASRNTLIRFIASDGVAANELFSVETLSYPEAFGFYKKNAQDNGDGTFVPSNADLVKLGYPVLLSFGVNNYPYVISKSDKNYVSGLSNSGGPVRVVFGKTQYNHPNGSNQIQYLSEIITGNDLLYNTHSYTGNKTLGMLAEETVKIKVTDASGKVLTDKNFTVRELEDIIYGEDVSAQDKKSAKVKAVYTLNGRKDIYEGIDAEYLLMEKLGIPGTNGIANFKGSSGSCSCTLEELFADLTYNPERNGDSKSIIAFAKNGSPLTANETDNGYIKEIALNPYLKSDPAAYRVDNQGGPLMFIRAGEETPVCSLSEIEITLVPDSYAHLDEDMIGYQSDTVRFYGPGLEKECIISVGDIEGMQSKAVTLDYSMLSKGGSAEECRYRGVAVYELFKQIGINNNAGSITVTCGDGSSQTYSLVLLKKSYPNFISEDKDNVFAMLAYGSGDISADRMSGTPLTESTGGPLMLVVPQESKDSTNKSLCLKNVVSVYVDANEITTWGHKMSDVYSEFLDYTFTVSFKNDDCERSVEYKLSELEEMEDIIVNDKYTVLDIGTCEGIDIWKLLKKTAGDAVDISKPISISAFAEDGYSNDLFANCGITAFTDGVASESGDRKVILLAYAVNGYPLVDTENHEGYTGMAKNCDGPLRVVVEAFQGGSIKYCNKISVTLAGGGEINIGQ